MSHLAMQAYPAAFTERAVKLAVASEPSIAQTARDLGGNAHTLPTWSGTYHRATPQTQQVHDAPLDEERQRLRTDNARCKEERESVNKAAASCAPPLPCRTPGGKRRTPSLPSGVSGGAWQCRGAATTSGVAARHALPLRPISRGKRPSSAMLCRGVAPMARAAFSRCGRRRAGRAAGAAADDGVRRRASAAQRGAHFKRLWPLAQPRRWPRTAAPGR
jgi:transposase